MSRRPRRRPTPLVVSVIVAGMAVLASCSVDEAMQGPQCQDSGASSALIVAQSVPGTDFIPCLERLPEGWTLDTVHIDEDGSTVRLDSDRAGEGAATLHFAETCDTGAAVPVPSEFDGAEKLSFIEGVDPGFRGRRHYLFAGGCVTWEFDFDQGVSPVRTIEITSRLQLFSRAAFNRILAETFIDEPV